MATPDAVRATADIAGGAPFRLHVDARDIRQQAIAASPDAGDIARVPGIIVQRIAQQLDALADGFGADDEPAPDAVHQLVLRYDARRRFDQCDEEVEAESRERDGLVAA